jgi:hypothetical protein
MKPKKTRITCIDLDGTRSVVRVDTSFEKAIAMLAESLPNLELNDGESVYATVVDRRIVIHAKGGQPGYTALADFWMVLEPLRRFA